MDKHTDKLALRRALYTAPAQVSTQQLQHDPELQLLQQQLLAQDEQIKQLLQLEVPANLADKILLQQKFARRSSWRVMLAMAAGTALFSSYLFWQPSQPDSDLGQHALRHVYHELAALKMVNELPTNNVSALLASIGVQQELPLPVRYARFCELEGVRSLHMVVLFEGAPVTVFVLPSDVAPMDPANQQFADSRFIGKQLRWQQHQILVVTEQPELLSAFSEQLNKLHLVNT
jgi:hypothetical protein